MTSTPPQEPSQQPPREPEQSAATSEVGASPPSESPA
ncbi:MAG: hypothetical protein QOC66_3154, partial [Pseudonocardiales bacterium]|nr:hypothetical protein [Pseudonocardiales bacterium]